MPEYPCLSTQSTLPEYPCLSTQSTLPEYPCLSTQSTPLNVECLIRKYPRRNIVVVLNPDQRCLGSQPGPTLLWSLRRPCEGLRVPLREYPEYPA
jgi:hypothetical protein